MNFNGFTLPDGAWLPPELINILPYISGSTLKAVIAILYHNLQVGGADPLSLADIEKYTGLSRRQVIRVLTELLEDGVIERQAMGQSYVYLPSLKTSDILAPTTDKMSPVSAKMSPADLRESDRELNINLIKDSLSDSLDSYDKMSLVKKMRSCGVYLKTAQGLVADFPEERIEKAIQTNLAQGPGWLVQAIKEGWGEPLGWKKNGTGCGCAVCAPVREAGAYGGWDE